MSPIRSNPSRKRSNERVARSPDTWSQMRTIKRSMRIVRSNRGISWEVENSENNLELTLVEKNFQEK